MKRSIILLIFLFHAVSGDDWNCTWTNSAIPKNGIQDLLSGFLVGGVMNNQAVFIDGWRPMQIYDIQTGTWQTGPILSFHDISSVTKEANDVVAVSVDDKVLFFGNVLTSPTPTYQFAAVQLDSNGISQWILGPSRKGFSASSTVRYGSGHIVTSHGLSSSLSDVIDRYPFNTPSGFVATGTQLLALPARDRVVAVSVSPYILFGFGSTGSVSYSGAVNIYDTTTQTMRPELVYTSPVPRSRVAATKKDNLAFFAGGATNYTKAGSLWGFTCTDAVDIFNALTSTWDSTRRLSVARRQLTAVSGSYYVYFAGGILTGGGASSVIDLYDVINQSWSVQHLSVARHGFAAVSIAGQVIFAGGVVGPYEQFDANYDRGVNVATVEMHFCHPCRPGSYSEDGICLMCDAGSYSLGSSCEFCPQNTYSLKGAANCTSCPPRMFSDFGSSTCKLCPPGTFWTNSTTRCTPCPSGTYSSVFGAIKCKKCPFGTYSQNTTGQAECSACLGIPSKKASCTVGTCNWDQICNSETENCISCPSDCRTCVLDGWLAEYYRNYFTSPILIDRRFAPSMEVDGSVFANGETGVVVFTSRFRPPQSATWQFQITGARVGARFGIRNVSNSPAFEERDYLMTYLTRSPSITLTNQKYLYKDQMQDLTFHVVIRNESLTTLNVSLKYRFVYPEPPPSYLSVYEPYLSIPATFMKNICGDGICDDNEACAIDCPIPDDGYCNVVAGETQKTSSDCWHLYSSRCEKATSSEILRPLAPGKPLKDDTFGNLIANQVIWRLPGIEHMQHGVNIVTGRESTNPLFELQYCSDDIIQDQYRGNVYALPKEYTATSEPYCSFQTSTRQFSSSESYARSLAKESSFSVGTDVGGKIGGISGSLKASYSQEKSVKTASEISSEKSSTLSVTSAYCLTYKTSIRNYNFHRVFLEEVRNANTSSTQNCVDLVTKYGSHYYVSAEMGGKLTQIIATRKEDFSSSNSKELSEMSSESFSTSVGGFGLSASLDSSLSSSTKATEEQKQKFSQSASKSSIITYGGPPGSFGPSSGDAPSTWGEWAGSLDLLPVPVNYQLEETHLLFSRIFGETNKITKCWRLGTIGLTNPNDISSVRIRFTTTVVNATAPASASTSAAGPFYIRVNGIRNLEDVSSNFFLMKDKLSLRPSYFPPSHSYEIDLQIPQYFDNITSVTFRSSLSVLNSTVFNNFKLYDSSNGFVSYLSNSNMTFNCSQDACFKTFNLVPFRNYHLSFQVPQTPNLRYFFLTYPDFTVTATIEGTKGSISISKDFTNCLITSDPCLSRNHDRFSLELNASSIGTPQSVIFGIETPYQIAPSNTRQCTNLTSSSMTENEPNPINCDIEGASYPNGEYTVEVRGQHVLGVDAVREFHSTFYVHLRIYSPPTDFSNITLTRVFNHSTVNFSISRYYVPDCSGQDYILQKRKVQEKYTEYYLTPGPSSNCCASLPISNVELIAGSTDETTPFYSSFDSFELNDSPSAFCTNPSTAVFSLDRILG